MLWSVESDQQTTACVDQIVHCPVAEGGVDALVSKIGDHLAGTTVLKAELKSANNGCGLEACRNHRMGKGQVEDV